MHIGSNSAFDVYTTFTPSASKLKSAMNRLAKSSGTKSPKPTAATGSRVRASEIGTTKRQGADRANSMMQTAEGWLDKAGGGLATLSELLAKPEATDQFDTALDEVRHSLGQYNEMRQDDELREFLAHTSEDGAPLPEVNADALQIGQDADDASEAINALAGEVAEAREQVAGQKATVVTAREGILENIRAAENKIRDRRVAEEMTGKAKEQILSQIGSAMLTQAKPLSESAMSLLN